MKEFDEFANVSDPREYLNAPAMMMMDKGDTRTTASTSPPPRLPLIVKAAVEYADFEILSADELQQYYAEQSSLDRRLAEVVNRLDVELKMREAAQSISRLHSGDVGNGNRRSSIVSNRSSIVINSPKANNRLSRLLGQDSHTKSEKRLSKQAADEAAISSEKIKDLENHRAELERRKHTVDLTIMQHHCTVMSRALSSKPLPNHHQRSRSGTSAISSLSQNSNRQSWIMAPKHQRQWSSTSNGDSASLATVTEHRSISTSTSARSKNNIEEDLDALIAKISQVLPPTSPTQGKVSYITKAFDSMFRDLSETRNALEASRIQIDHLDQKLQHLHQNEVGSNSSRGTDCNVNIKELKHGLDIERSVTLQWRTAADDQRKKLETTAKSLEDVTRLAVELEGEHASYRQLVHELESKISDLESEKVIFLQQKLKSTSNTSLLCQEFQQIINDLVARHEREVRALYPKFSKRAPIAASQNCEGTSAEDLLHKKQTETSFDQNVTPSTGTANSEPVQSPLDSRKLPMPSQGNYNDYSYEHSFDNTYSLSNEHSELPVEASSDNSIDEDNQDILKLPSESQPRLPQSVESSNLNESLNGNLDERPHLARYNTEESDYSKSSSYYPEIQSANQSQASIATNRNNSNQQSYRYDYDDEIL